jgi:hypothetical protein
MKHARPDYDRIQDPAGLIPEDEPVFLLRGQDRYAASVLEMYAVAVEANQGNSELVRLTRQQAKKMKAWPKHKEPDLPDSHSR